MMIQVQNLYSEIKNIFYRQPIRDVISFILILVPCFMTGHTILLKLF